MQSLSQNLLCEIFSFLTLKELLVVSSTCRRLSKISESDNLWTTSSDKGSGAARKKIFSYRCKYTCRIFSKTYQILYLSGSSRTINSIKVNQNKILTASEDSSVRLFNTKKLTGKKILNHSNSVISAKFWEKGVVSISADRCLKIWRKGKNDVSISAHKSRITKLRLLDNNIAATGGYDGTVKLWSLDGENKIPILASQDFSGDISVLESFGNYYASCSSWDSTICLRDIQRPSNPTRFGISNPVRPSFFPNIGCVRSLLLNPPYLFSGEAECIKLWDMRDNAAVVQIFEENLNLPYYYRDGIFKIILNEPHQLLVGSNGLMGLVEFDLRTLKSNYFPVHNSRILTLCQGSNTLKNLVVTSGDSKSKTYKYEISVHETNNLSKSIKFTPSRKGVINSIDIGENCIASGEKDGSAHVIMFNKSREILKRDFKTINVFS